MSNVTPFKSPQHLKQVHDALLLLKVLTAQGHSPLVISEVIAKAEHHLAQHQETSNRR